MASVIISSGPTLADVETYSKEAGLNLYVRPDGKFDVFSTDVSAVETYYKQLDPATAELIIHKLEPRLNVLQRSIDPATFAPGSLRPSTNLSPAGVGGESYFTADQLGTIYDFPTPSAGPYVIGVVSFGGGLYGSVNADGVLTGGDVQTYWTSLGIPAGNHPKVVVVPINGATNTPSMNDGAATSENTLDVETLGALYPRSNVTIILYIAPNSLENFAPLLSYMLNTDVVVGGVNYRPNIISCSWGAPEVYYSSSLLNSINAVMSTMNSAGITICTATGDNGSTNGVASGFISGVTNYVDFPSSSPCSTAVGGTNLFCPNNVYDGSTVESAWTYGGGGVSTYFDPPSYQASLGKSKRSIPDLAAVADPATGVLFFINSSYYVFGGTSVAAPVVCAFLASINCKVFINPLLYDAFPSSYNDITLGNNGGFNTEIAGYDNCTGLGTMKGSLLSAAINAIRVTGVTLNRGTASLQVGNPSNNTVQLTATVAPNDASNKDLTWISSSPSATVSNTGLVTAVSAGTTTITVQTADGGKTASCVVTVSAFIPVTGVTLNRTTATIATGPSNGVTLVATVFPTNATNRAFVWSSNSVNATVATNGRVTGVTAGSATITATTTDGNFTASCIVTVVAAVSVTGIGLDKRSVFLPTAGTITLVPTIYPANASNTTINWTTSTPATATVNISTGLVTAVAAGTTTITATTADGAKVATCLITVYVPPFVNVTGVTLNNSSLTIEPGNTPSLIATVAPTSATNKNLVWSSNSPNVTVDQSGGLKGVSPGIATITVTTENGGFKAFCTVLVNAPPVININPPSFTVSSGSITNITATVTRPGLANSAITWSSSSAIVTLPTNGSVSGGTGNTTIMSIPVRGISNGTATISATYGGVTATATVTVFTNVQGIRLNAGNITLSIGNTFQAIPSIIPPTSNNAAVTWSTSAASVAIVSASGLITARGNGIATVRATTRDGNKSAIISVRVSTGPTSVSINVHTITIARGQSYNLLATVTPQYVSSVAVAWSSANPKIASISSMGVVRALLVGTTTITARIPGFPLTDTCVITVV
jgi:uncharacterized protein YjdB